MHTEYKRMAEGAHKAILLIHGIVGTPNHFKALIPLVPEDMSVYNILLDGHGKGVKDFSKASMKRWEEQVCAAVSDLAKTHKEIYIAAHSMGCLLAIEQAVKRPVIKKMFLLAVPLKLCIKPKMLRNSLCVYLNKVDPNDEELMAAKACYGIKADKNPLHYIGWVPRFLELFSKIKDTRKTVESVRIPCVACQSAGDEMVSNRSKAILEKNPAITVVELKNSGHYYYEKQDYFRMMELFKKFLE